MIDNEVNHSSLRHCLSFTSPRLLFEAFVELLGDELAVEVLTDEDELLHAVAIVLIPVALHTRVGLEELL